MLLNSYTAHVSLQVNLVKGQSRRIAESTLLQVYIVIPTCMSDVEPNVAGWRVSSTGPLLTDSEDSLYV